MDGPGFTRPTERSEIIQRHSRPRELHAPWLHFNLSTRKFIREGFPFYLLIFKP